jgi:hypothetical protein
MEQSPDLALLEDIAPMAMVSAPDGSRRARRVKAIAVGQNLDAVAVLEVGLPRRLEHVHAVIAARVDRRLDVKRDVRHEQQREVITRRTRRR